MSFVLKRCNDCGSEKPLEDFHRSPNTSDGRQGHCKLCNTDQNRRWKAANPERSRQLNSESARRQHERAKRAVINAYGGSCTCCGESDIHFLTVEHVTAESSKRHRYPNGRRISGTKLLRLIASEGFPDDITVLCHNCNCARGQYGGCPHQSDFNPRYIKAA